MVADTVPLVPALDAGMGIAGWTLLISAVTAGIVSIINTIGNFWGRTEARQTATAVRERLVTEALHIKDTVANTAATTTAKLDTADRKLDVIHDLTNSNMSALKAQLATALARIDSLETALIAKMVPLANGQHQEPH